MKKSRKISRKRARRGIGEKKGLAKFNVSAHQGKILQKARKGRPSTGSQSILGSPVRREVRFKFDP